MWYHRDLFDNIEKKQNSQAPLVRVLQGPRQVGKTSLLDQLEGFQLVSFDDHIIRSRASDSPSLFLDQFQGPLILDEATLVPELFPEIKKRVDQAKRNIRKDESADKINYWITGSNQTLLSKNIQESLAGRAEFYSLNTLSLHEIGQLNIQNFILRGGWPELHAEPELNSVKYLNGLISTFIEKDIVQAAGIEKKAAFTKSLQLLAGQCGELTNYSAIASSVGVESTTIQSWALILEQNGILKRVAPYMNNINKRLIKTPKIYFEDVGLLVRLQGWTTFEPLMVSPYYGHIIENIAYSEISRFFTNRGDEMKISFLRDKSKTEVDFILELPNKKFISIEVKTTPRDYTKEQLKLLDSTKLDFVENWILSPEATTNFGTRKVVSFLEVYDQLLKHY